MGVDFQFRGYHVSFHLEGLLLVAALMLGIAGGLAMWTAGRRRN